MSEKVVFSSALTTRIRSGIPHFEADEAAFKAELAKKYEKLGGRVGGLRIHPSIRKFCSDYWSEQTSRMQFESKRAWGECSREVARRDGWVYFSGGAVGEFERYDIDIAGGGQEDDE